MATASSHLQHDQHDERTEVIASVISAELDRQAMGGAPRVDVTALASAIDAAITPDRAGLEEGKHPDELKSSNDD